MSISPHSRESLWQQNNLQSNIKSQHALFLTGRLILLTLIRRFSASQSATESSFFLIFALTNSSLSHEREHQPTQQSTEPLQTVSVNIWWCFFPLVPKVCWIQTGEVNIVECLILYTCGDYVPFDIRYALVKWVLTAFPSQSRIQVHVCRATHGLIMQRNIHI